MNDEELEIIIEQAINGAISTIPGYMDEIKENKKTLMVEDPKEFVYGMVMGMALGISGAVLSSQKEMPTYPYPIHRRGERHKSNDVRFSEGTKRYSGFPTGRCVPKNDGRYDML